ncbi:acetoin dehydrogenase [Salmonella enterica subsp. enterica]|nr:acetoin dehydrogenase [Salmonella enterica subsp. enterica]
MTKVAIVTASDSGIGKACALLLAQNGFDIGITWHSDERGAQETAKKAAQFGVRVETIHLDLSQLPEGAQAIEHLIQRLGRVDVLVNNAGAMTKSAFIDMPFYAVAANFYCGCRRRVSLRADRRPAYD